MKGESRRCRIDLPDLLLLAAVFLTAVGRAARFNDLWAALESWLQLVSQPAVLHEAFASVIANASIAGSLSPAVEANCLALCLLPVAPHLATKRSGPMVVWTTVLGVAAGGILLAASRIPNPWTSGFPFELEHLLLPLTTLLPAVFLARTATSGGGPEMRWLVLAIYGCVPLVVLQSRGMQFVLGSWVDSLRDRPVLELCYSATVLVLNRAIWLAAAVGIWLAARQWQPRLRDRGLAVVLVVAVSVVEGIRLWTGFMALSPQEAEQARAALFFPPALLLCASVATTTAMKWSWIRVVPVGVLVAWAAASGVLVFEGGLPSSPYELLCVGALDCVLWLATTIVLALVIRRWRNSQAAIGIACLLFSASQWCPAILRPFLFPAEFVQASFSQLGGAIRSAPTAGFVIVFELMAVVCAVAMLERRRAFGTFCIAALLLLGGARWLQARRATDFGIWEPLARSAGALRLALRHPPVIDQAQPRVTEGSAGIQITDDGNLVRTSGEYTLHNACDEPITRVVVTVNPNAEDLHLSLGAMSSAVTNDDYGVVELSLDPPLATGANVHLFFSEVLQRSLLRPEVSGLGGSVALLSGPAAIGDLLPIVGVGRTEQMTEGVALRVAMDGGWNDDILRSRLPDSLDAEPSELNLRIEVTTPAEWRAAASGTRVLQIVEKGVRRTAFQLVHNPKSIALLAADYGAVTTLDAGVPVTVLSASAGALAEATRDDILSSLSFEGGVFGALPVRALSFADVPLPHVESKLGGQAYPGLVVLRERLPNDYSRRPETIAHEIAHQWLPLAANLSWWNQPVEEAIAEGVALEWLREKRNPALNTFLRDIGHHYFEDCRGHEEPSLGALGAPGSDCATSVTYGKGGLGMMAVADFMGPARYHQALQQFIDSAKGHPPPYPDLNDFAAAMIAAENKNGVRRILEDLWNSRVTFRNEVRDLSISNGELDFTVVMHKFNDGAATSHADPDGESFLPIGGIDCQGQPVISTWGFFRNDEPVRYTVSGLRLREVGTDPWGEMLDDGADNLVDVPGMCDGL